MRVISLTVCAVIALIREPQPQADSYGHLSVGAAELVQLELGYANPRWSVGLRGGLIIFNAAAGISVTRYFGTPRLGRAPRHSLLLGGQAMVNVFEPGLRGGGETIASYLGLRTGYQFASDSGFLFMAELGAVGLWQDSGPEAGPLVALGVGWRF